jgi:dienelactone hydrolase
MNIPMESKTEERLVLVATGAVTLEGNLSLPEGAAAVVLFAHGSGSSRHSPRNRRVARLLNQAKLATLLVDLLTAREEAMDLRTAHLRFNIGLLAERLIGATDWLTEHPDTRHLRVGYFGASTGAGAALVAAAERPEVVGAVVSRGGRPDLAGPPLARVQAPTLLIVGGNDLPVIQLNRMAFARLRGEKQLVIVPGATHLFEEPGALDEVARLAREWFEKCLVPDEARATGPAA